MKRLLIVAITLAPLVAHATGTTPPPKPDPAPAPTSTSTSQAGAQAGAAAGAIAGAAATGGRSSASTGPVNATGGASSASTGDAVATSGDSTATATTDGNSQAIEYNTPRQVPPVFLAGLMVSECGTGASAGGAGSGGAGAFGVVWTTKRCYALRSAINFFAVGEYRTGCELLAYVNREALKIIGRPLDCEAMAVRLEQESRMTATAAPPAAPPPAAAPPPDMSKYVTREEAERMWRQSVSK